jgi:hypothetical protein
MGVNTSSPEYVARQGELLAAVKQGEWGKASNLILSGADINYTYRVETETTSLLLTAVHANAVDLVQRLMERGAKPGFEDDLGWNCFLYACWGDDIDEAIGLYMLKKRPRLAHSMTHLGYTPLHFAASKGKHKIVQMLLKHGVDPDAPATGDYGVPLTPLNLATRYPSFGVDKLTTEEKRKVKDRRRTILLLVRAGANLDVVDQTEAGKGFTPMLQCMQCQGDYQKWQPDFGVLCFMLLNGADPNTQSLPPLSSDDQDKLSTQHMAIMCITEAEAPGRLDIPLFNRMSNVFELLNDMKKGPVAMEAARNGLERSYLEATLLVAIETLRKWGVGRKHATPKERAGAFGKAIEAWGEHEKGYQKRRAFVKHWPYSYYHAAKSKQTVGHFVAHHMRAGGGEGENEFHYVVEEQKIKKAGDVKKKGDEYLRFYLRPGMCRQLEGVAEAVENSGARWKQTLWILFMVPPKALASIQNFLLNPFLTKAVQTLSKSIDIRFTVGPYYRPTTERVKEALACGRDTLVKTSQGNHCSIFDMELFPAQEQEG